MLLIGLLTIHNGLVLREMLQIALKLVDCLQTLARQIGCQDLMANPRQNHIISSSVTRERER